MATSLTWIVELFQLLPTTALPWFPQLKHWTADGVVRLEQSWKWHMKDGEPTCGHMGLWADSWAPSVGTTSKLAGLVIYLYNIGYLITLNQLLRLFNTDSYVRLFKYLSGTFPIRNGLKQGHDLLPLFFNFRVNVGPCHNGIGRPRVVDVGDGLQIWRVAANVLDKQWRTADNGWSSSLRVGRGANITSP
jgi:hypothetical protein